jgi:hypothetical protein
MDDAFRQMFIGLSAVFFSPANSLPRPRTLITLPPKSATEAIAFDFSRISGDLNIAIDKVKNEKQIEMDLKSERHAA